MMRRSSAACKPRLHEPQLYRVLKPLALLAEPGVVAQPGQRILLFPEYAAVLDKGFLEPIPRKR